MKPQYSRLEWDSNFFGFEVGLIRGLIQNETDLKNTEAILQMHNCHLSYYSSPNELEYNALSFKEFEVKFVDKKITYVKGVKPNSLIHKSILKYKNREPNEKLLSLARKSGSLSRFNMDENISIKKYEELYDLWMINSLNGKIAKEVLVSIINQEIVGVITLTEKNNRAAIGIISVEDSFHGQGVGKILMTSAEAWFSEEGYKTIEVVTQSNNIAACKLYEKCGYTVNSTEYFYHFWKK